MNRFGRGTLAVTITTEERRLFSVAGWLLIGYIALTFAGVGFEGTLTLGEGSRAASAALVDSSMPKNFTGGYIEFVGTLVYLVGALLLARLLRGDGPTGEWFSSCISASAAAVDGRQRRGGVRRRRGSDLRRAPRCVTCDGDGSERRPQLRVLPVRRPVRRPGAGRRRLGVPDEATASRGRLLGPPGRGGLPGRHPRRANGSDRPRQPARLRLARGSGGHLPAARPPPGGGCSRKPGPGKRVKLLSGSPSGSTMASMGLVLQARVTVAAVVAAVTATVAGLMVSQWTAIEDDQSIVLASLNSAVILAFAVVGAVIAAARPDNRVGWLMLAGGVTWSLGSASVDLAHHGIVTAPGSVPGASALAVVGAGVRAIGWYLETLAVPMYFPDGRLAGPRFRWLSPALVVILVAAILDPLTDPRADLTDLGGWRNPVAPHGPWSLISTAAFLGHIPLSLVATVGVVLGLLARWRTRRRPATPSAADVRDRRGAAGHRGTDLAFWAPVAGRSLSRHCHYRSPSGSRSCPAACTTCAPPPTARLSG